MAKSIVTRYDASQEPYMKKKSDNILEHSAEQGPDFVVEVLNGDDRSGDGSIPFDQLLALADEEVLLRIGLGAIETMARVGGRVLWH